MSDNILVQKHKKSIFDNSDDELDDGRQAKALKREDYCKDTKIKILTKKCVFCKNTKKDQCSCGEKNNDATTPVDGRTTNSSIRKSS